MQKAATNILCSGTRPAPTKEAHRTAGPVTGDAHRSDGVQTLRCECGRLLARVLKSAVELKCARCKRVVILVGGRRYEKAGVAACDCLESLGRAESNSQPRNNGPARSQ